MNNEIMKPTQKPRTNVKVGEHRARRRASGLRSIQFWVPDVRTAAFKAEAHRQALAVATSALEAEDQAFIDSIADWSDD